MSTMVEILQRIIDTEGAGCMRRKPLPYHVTKRLLRAAGIGVECRAAVLKQLGYASAPMHVRLSKNAPPSRFYVPAGWSRQQVLEALEAQRLG